MMQDWTGVEEGGQSLQGACERMLEERVRDFLRPLRERLLKGCPEFRIG